MRFSDGIYTPPTGCNLDGCRSKSFTPQKKTALSIDWQKIRIQVCSRLSLASCMHLFISSCGPFMDTFGQLPTSLGTATLLL